MAKFLDYNGLAKVIDAAKLKLVPSLTLDKVGDVIDNGGITGDTEKTGFDYTLVNRYLNACKHAGKIIPIGDIGKHSYDICSDDKKVIAAAQDSLISFFNLVEFEVFGANVSLRLVQDMSKMDLAKGVSTELKLDDESGLDYPLVFDSLSKDKCANHKNGKKSVGKLYRNPRITANPHEGSLKAEVFQGNLLGEATKAIQDGNGNNIANTYATKSDVSALGSVLNFKGTQASVSALPASDNKTGDVWHVTEKSAEYVWTGSAWEELGSVIEVPLESVKVNGSPLAISDKSVNITVTEGTANGTVKVNGTDVTVHGLGTAAYTASSAYATAAQGAKADTALQPSDMVAITEDEIDALF